MEPLKTIINETENEKIETSITSRSDDIVGGVLPQRHTESDGLSEVVGTAESIVYPPFLPSDGSSDIGLLLGVDKILEYQLEKETDFLPDDGMGSQEELIDHLKRRNDELSSTAKHYKLKYQEYEKKIDQINIERKREITSVTNFYQTLLFDHSRAATMVRLSVSKK